MSSFELTVDARPGDAGQPIGVLGTAFDVTDRRRDERRMRLMMRALTHRSKNLLAVIQAMARKTASLSDDIEDFIADSRHGSAPCPRRTTCCIAVLAWCRPSAT